MKRNFINIIFLVLITTIVTPPPLTFARRTKTTIQNVGFKPLDALHNNPTLKAFIENVLTKRYTNWGLPANLVKYIFATLEKYRNNPEQARQRVYAETIDFETNTDWQEAYNRYKSATKYTTTFSQIEQVLGSLPIGATVVDVGCGNNILGKEIAINNPKISIIGTDTYDYHEEHGLSNLNFLQQSSPFDIPIGEESVDVIILNATLHHVSPEEIGEFLNELSRILKPGGKVILVEDTWSENIPFKTEESDIELTNEFLSLVEQYGEDFAKEYLIFNDWYSNIVVHQWDGMAMPYNFHSMESWQTIFQNQGFTTSETLFFGFLKQTFHKPSVGIIVFTN
ncbi:MAG: class I SAM-dependent methyltransferase [Candidatus Saelkia tenebricola]|nr:class I SAM-dependent methyltransferase [Candidatus Saelkia tenebricola]